MIKSVDSGEVDLKPYPLGDLGLFGDGEVEDVLGRIAQSAARHIAEGRAKHLLGGGAVDNESHIAG